MSRISIIGSGEMTRAIGSLAAKAGHAVEIISRDPAKAEALARQIGCGAAAGRFGATPGGDLVVLAVPYTAVLDLVTQYGDGLSGRILIDITNPVGSDLSSFLTPEDSSGALEIARVAPAEARVVKAFNTINAGVLSSGQMLDVLVAADGSEAKERVCAFIRSLGLRPLDAGPLAMAQTLEHACMLVLGLARHSIRHSKFSIGIRRFD